MRTHKDMSIPTHDQVFVFGSNLAGRHGAGAALFAKQRLDAQAGKGVGPTHRTYAIPTKDERLNSMPLYHVKDYVNLFIDYVKANPNKQFFVTRVGCGLAGNSDTDMAELFREIWDFNNCSFPEEWAPTKE